MICFGATLCRFLLFWGLKSCTNCFTHTFIKRSPVWRIFGQCGKLVFLSRTESRTFHIRAPSTHSFGSTFPVGTPRLFCPIQVCQTAVISIVLPRENYNPPVNNDRMLENLENGYCRALKFKPGHLLPTITITQFIFSVYLKIALNPYCLPDHQTTINFLSQALIWVKLENEILTWLVWGFISLNCWRHNKNSIEKT